jgi:hypothetical protein
MDETIKQIIRDLMEDPTASVELFRSMNETDGAVGKSAGTPDRSFEPGQGRTVVLKVHGGANNVDVRRVKTEDDEKFEKEHEL